MTENTKTPGTPETPEPLWIASVRRSGGGRFAGGEKTLSSFPTTWEIAVAWVHAQMDSPLGDVVSAGFRESPARTQTIEDRLEYLRGCIEAEDISYPELAELQSLASYIDLGDVQLLEWAGVPEFVEEPISYYDSEGNEIGPEFMGPYYDKEGNPYPLAQEDPPPRDTPPARETSPPRKENHRESRRVAKEIEYRVAMDNYEPTREFDSGTIEVWVSDDNPDYLAYVLVQGNPWMRNQMVPENNIGFILDDGMRTVPCYVAGWNPTQGTIFLMPIPTNPDGRTRPDGRVIEYWSWMLGPRKTYHLKVDGTL